MMQDYICGVDLGHEGSERTVVVPVSIDKSAKRMQDYISKSVWRCTKCKRVYVDRVEPYTVYCCGKLLMKHYEYTNQYQNDLIKAKRKMYEEQER